jgi:hypothetical protein
VNGQLTEGPSTRNGTGGLVVNYEQPGDESRLPAGLQKHWLTIAAELLGFPLSWTQRPPLLYTDPQVYPVRLSSRKVVQHRRIDTVLTRDRYFFKELEVQATKSVQNQPNGTWQRHSLKEVRTTTMAIGETPLVSKARFDMMFGHTNWGPWVSWIWYFFMWIFSFTTMMLWLVSTSPRSKSK